MSGSRKTRAQRREQILECARDAFANKGYHAVTVDEIVAKVKVARGTFYLYFPDKRAVFEAIVDAFFETVTGAIKSIDLESGTPALAQLRANMTRLAQLAVQEPAAMKIVLRDTAGVDPDFDRKIQSFYRALRQFLGESLEEGQRIGLVRDGDRDVMIALGIGALKEILLETVTGEVARTPEQLVDEIMRFLERGLVA